MMEPLLLIKYFVMTLVGVVLILLMLPFILPFVILFGIVCVLAQIAIKIRYGSTAYKANATDIIHGKETERCVAVISIGMNIKGKLNMKTVRDRMCDVITKTYNSDGQRRYKRLMESYEIKFGYRIWRTRHDDHFNIEDHVKEVDFEDLCAKSGARGPDGFVPLNGATDKYDWTTVMKIMQQAFHRNTFASNKSPWEMLVVKDGTNSFSILFRFHHAISDGVYLLRFFYEDMLDQPCYIFGKRETSHPFAKILTSLWSFSLLPFGLWNAMPNLDHNPLHGPTLSGTKKYYMSNRVPLDVIHTIKKGCPFKVSSNAILFSCISFAISKHFRKRSSQADKIMLVIPLPQQKNTDEFKLENKFALSILEFPVPLITESCDKDSPALNRLEMVQKCFEKMSRDASISALNSLINGFCCILPNTIAEAFLTTKGCTTAVSRLPGSERELKVYGGELTEHIFWIPDRDPMGIGFGICGYNGGLRASVIIDEVLIVSEDEGNFIMEDFEAEIYNQLGEQQESKNNLTKEKQNTLEFAKSTP